MMKLLHDSLGTLLGLIGVSAVVSGTMMMLDPSGTSMGLSVDVLARSPFADFRIPAMILFTVNGLGSLVGAWLAWTRRNMAAPAGFLLGAVLCGWILFQVQWIPYSPLQTVIFVIGCLEMIFALLIVRTVLRRKNPAA